SVLVFFAALLFGDGFVKYFLEVVERPWIFDLFAVQDEGRRRREAFRTGVVAVSLDTVVDSFTLHVFAEFVHIYRKLFSKTLKDRGWVSASTPCLLVFVQHVMHLPELALQSCGFGGTRTDKRVLMDFGQREVAELERYAAF